MAIGFKGAPPQGSSSQQTSQGTTQGTQQAPQGTQGTQGTQQGVQQPVNDLRKPEVKSGNSKKNVIVIVAIVVIVAVIALVVSSLLSKNEESSGNTSGTITLDDGSDSVDGAVASSEVASPSDQLVIDPNAASTPATTSSNPNAVYDENGNLISNNGVYDADGNVINDDAINPGKTQYSGVDGNSTSAIVYSSSDFIKDLNGLDISASWVNDYVNYERKRAIMDDGMELYWLECTYNSKKYRMQIPFYAFKSLDDTGIIEVTMELLNLEGGEKVISYMQPNYDVLN